MGKFFIVRYCDEKCEFPENAHCFAVSQKSVFRCTRCVAKEVAKTWRCEGCQREFSGFDEYFELPVPPPVSAQPGETVISVPAIVHIKKLCKSCYEQVGGFKPT
jgi:hypothetical protein